MDVVLCSRETFDHAVRLAAHREAELLEDELEGLEIESRYRVLEGHPPEEIVAHAKRSGADLVVTAHPGQDLLGASAPGQHRGEDRAVLRVPRSRLPEKTPAEMKPRNSSRLSGRPGLPEEAENRRSSRKAMENVGRLRYNPGVRS